MQDRAYDPHMRFCMDIHIHRRMHLDREAGCVVHAHAELHAACAAPL